MTEYAAAASRRGLANTSTILTYTHTDRYSAYVMHVHVSVRMCCIDSLAFLFYHIIRGVL